MGSTVQCHYLTRTFFTDNMEYVDNERFSNDESGVCLDWLGFAMSEVGRKAECASKRKKGGA